MVNVCAECFAESGETCCSCNGSGIFITLHDALRVKRATGLDFEDFMVFDKVPDEWIDELKEHNDPFLDLLVDGKVLQLKLTPKGCVFLGPKGCTIFEHRPSLCRTFPFGGEVNDDGSVTLTLNKDDSFEDEGCLLVKRHYYDKDMSAALKEMGEDEAEFKEFIKRDIEASDLYERYAPLLAKGVSFEEVIKRFKITV